MRNDFCTDYLEHSAAGTTWEKTKHKYIERKLVNGKWVYRYTKDSPRARGEQFQQIIGNPLTASRRERNSDFFKANHPNYREAEYQGRKAAEETYQRMNENYVEGKTVAEADYEFAQPIDYYANQGEAFIKRIFKKK